MLTIHREITKLKLRAIEKTEPETKINDYMEMKRRIKLFVEKWDRILWIEHYEENNNKLPSETEVVEELELSRSVAQVYLEYYEHIESHKTKDLDELILEFNVYNDVIIWWFEIMSLLKQYPSKSLWLIFEKVAEITPARVSIALLEEYQYDLTRFDAENLNRICQNIVIGSQYPVCTALRISKWFNDRAEYDIARGQELENIAESYIEAANDYIAFLESDHLATIMLEAKSDIDELSALQMAQEYELISFVNNHRVEKITTSIMNEFEFLKPENKDDAFEIEPLSWTLIWNKMWTKE